MTELAYVPKTFDMFHVGDKSELDFLFTRENVKEFAEVTKDFNPLHQDDEFAAKTMFKECIAEGFFTASAAAALASPFFGIGTVNLGTTFWCTAPVRFNDTVKFVLEVTELFEEKHNISYTITGTRQDGVVVLKLDGQVKIMDKKK